MTLTNNANRRIRVLPYKQGSKGAKALAVALGGKVLKLVGSKFTERDSDFIINWGNSNEDKFDCLLNFPEDIEKVSNKLLFFLDCVDQSLADFLPQFWTSREDIPNDAYPVVCRTKLTGHSGEGIVIADSPEELVEASLYTKYIKKKDEYRVHLGLSSDALTTKVIAVQQKRRRTDHPDPNWQVRSHANGFVYCRSEIDPPASVVDSAIAVFEATGLCFGAVDVIWNEQQQRAYVLEVNSAPGLEGATVDDYANYFKELMDGE